jgi:3,4-dehydroadipyl-CoA semialdehyde dehydrogenase
VATLISYRSEGEAFDLIHGGGGSLACSIFTGDSAFASVAAVALAPGHGRVLVVDETVMDGHTGHGIVMPQCVHGGPGRAGGGEELGGLRGLMFYHQRTAVQGNVTLLEQISAESAELKL